MSRVVRKIWLLFFILLITPPILYSIAPQEPKFNVSLTKTQYTQKDILSGDIIFEITGPIENQYIKAAIGDIHAQIKIIDALKKTNVTYKSTPPIQDLYED